MKAIIDWSIDRGRLIVAALALLMLAGASSYLSIPKEADPDVNIPIVYVMLALEGISPEDAERLLVKPMEQELTGIDGLKEMSSNAFQGGANVVLEFEAGFDADKALTDVREKVDLAKPELPSDAEEPRVEEVNLSLFPVLVVSLSGPVSERTLLTLARELQDRIEAIPTVLEVEIGGDREQTVELIVDPLKLETYGLRATEIIDALTRGNQLVAAGSLDSGAGRYPVKVPGLFKTYADIIDMPIKAVDGQVITFRDVGTLRRSYKDPTGFARMNGEPAVTLEVSKRLGSNIIETIAAVRSLMAEVEPLLPEGVSIAFSQDKSNDIRVMLADLQSNVIAAVILVMIVVVGALGLRSGILVGVAIPGSFLTGILVLATGGLTVNIVVLFSLIMATGMLVDGAIIVVEYADRRMREGAPRRQAYAEAARRMAWPIITSTLTTICAFLPLLFWPGVVGEFMKYLPLTLIATLSASLLMAVIFVPTLGAMLGRHQPAPAGPVAEVDEAEADSRVDLAKVGGFAGGYMRLLAFCIRRPVKVVLAGVALLVATQLLYGAYGKGIEFFPSVEPDNAALQVHARGNLSVWERDQLLREVEERIIALQRERGEFHAIYARSVASSGTTGGDEAEDVIGTIQLEFVDWDARRPADSIIEDIRRRTADLAGVMVEPRKQEAGPPVGKPVQVQLSALDPALLAPAADAVVAAMQRLGGFVDIEDGKSVPGIEWVLDVDRAEAAKYGADLALIGAYVKMLTNGLKVTDYRPDDSTDEVDVVLRLPEEYRTLAQLDRIRVETNAGPVPISRFVERLAEPQVSILKRVDGNRAITVKADVGIDPATGQPWLVADKVAELQAALAQLEVPQGLRVEFRGEDEEQRAAQEFLGSAFLVALLLIAVVLLAQFNSFFSVGLILVAIVMSTIGVFLGLLITDQPFGIVMGGIGVIALAGIVVNNNIVLIDTFDKLLARSGDARDAILRTGAQRLRPVLLTTVTTALGLLPMVLAVNIDFIGRGVTVGAPSSQWWTQLSTAIAFGLMFATLLTLVFTPAALMARANWQAWRARRRARRQPPAPRAAPAALPALRPAAE
jgi:multidrug efflux pump